jgi:hypothetical protein
VGTVCAHDSSDLAIRCRSASPFATRIANHPDGTEHPLDHGDQIVQGQVRHRWV